VQADKKSGQTSLFGAFDQEESEEEAAAPTPLPEMDEWPEREKLIAEKEVLGYYLESHPLAEFEKKLSTFRTHTIDRLADAKDRDEVTLGGMISSIKIAHTKNPKPGQPSKYANFDLEDMQSSIRCISWPRGFANHGDKIQPDAVVLAKGKIDRRGGGDEANLIIDELTLFEELEGRYTHGMRIMLDEKEHGPETVHGLREILRGYPGKQDLMLSVSMTDGDVIQMKVDKQGVGITPELRERLEDFLGSGSYKLLMSKPR
jgi:DNA polymerase-3 subunit alpha